MGMIPLGNSKNTIKTVEISKGQIHNSTLQPGFLPLGTVVLPTA